MTIHLLSGFLGSGKTTAIQQAAFILLQQGVKTGVITNDQGSQLVDGEWFQHLAIPSRQVVNGCFCCNYQQLDDGIASLAAANGTEVIFAESVGSCTDIVATVLKPLLQFRPGAQVTVSTFADVRLLHMMLKENASSFDDAVRYIYLKQLEEAGIIVISKIDLVDKQALLAIKEIMQEKYSNKIVLYQNSLDNDCIQHWLNTISEYNAEKDPPSLQIDYDIYAAGEATMGWLDQSLEIFSPGNNALQEAEELINTIFESVKIREYTIGHIKFLVSGATKVSFTAAIDTVVVLPKEPAASVSLLVNMRVQAAPAALLLLVETCTRALEIQFGCRIAVTHLSAFQPGYPVPAYRL